jgi:hypothetical protein
MICPNCKSEYRPGITRCATCDVLLVERREAGSVAAGAPARLAEHPPEPLATYCGFLALEDARHARDTLRREGIASEIAIRDAEDAPPSDPVREEYWLRVPVRRFEAVARLLGFDEHEPSDEGGDDDSFACSACGAKVGAHDSTCPGCGQRFED